MKRSAIRVGFPGCRFTYPDYEFISRLRGEAINKKQEEEK